MPDGTRLIIHRDLHHQELVIWHDVEINSSEEWKWLEAQITAVDDHNTKTPPPRPTHDTTKANEASVNWILLHN
jgi:hypothetical protein